jgi:hypothetical protein
VSQVKQLLGILGLLAAVAGVALGYRWMVWVAIGLLGASIIVRMVIAAKARRSEEEPPSPN